MLGQLIKKMQKQEKAGLILVQKSRYQLSIGNGKSSFFDFKDAIHGITKQINSLEHCSVFSNLRKLVNLINTV